MDKKNNLKFERWISTLEKKPLFITIVVFVLVYLFMFIKFDISLLFKDTILTGGDSASWYQVALYLKEVLIPNFRLTGWDQANYFGYHNFQFYFIPPFLFAVLLSYIMPLTVALKLTTFLGIITLPLATHYSTKKITGKLWPALLGTALSLIFIYNPANSMFGGNFYSTLAGEFCYSISFSLFVYFIGVCFDTFKHKKSPLKAGLLLGLIGLCHMFVFMVAVFVPFFFLFAKKITEKKYSFDKNSTEDNTTQLSLPSYPIEKIGLIYIYGILLMAFWLIPMLATRQFSQSISMIWHYNGILDFLITTFFWAMLIGLPLMIVTFIKYKKSRLNAIFILYMYGVCGFLYLISRFLKIPDIRFIPPAIFVSLLALPVFLSNLKNHHKRIVRLLPQLTLTLALLGGFGLVIFNPFLNNWFTHNYGGYENTEGYPEMESLSEQLSGDINSGRILWDKLSEDLGKTMGSSRVFENLYLFTGRPSMEGIHYGSSHMSRETLYLTSEYTPNLNSAEADRLYSSVNTYVWPMRFYQANAKDIIVNTAHVQNKFNNHKDFTLTGNTESFDIYTYNDFPDSYIMIFEPGDINILENNGEEMSSVFLRWFRDYSLFEHPFIPEKFATGLEGIITNQMSYSDIFDKYYNENYNFDEWLSNYAYVNAITNENIEQMSIEFTTTAVGKPHIIKISYSPNFKSENVENIYPISPGFMMIIPETENVKITFGYNHFEIMGIILTLLLIPIIIFHKKIELIKLPKHETLSKILIVCFCGLVILFSGISTQSRRYIRMYRRAGLLYTDLKYEKAYSITDKYATLDNLEKFDDTYIYDFYVLKTKSLLKMQQTNAARDCFKEIINYYPTIGRTSNPDAFDLKRILDI